MAKRFSKLNINIGYIDKYIESGEELVNILKGIDQTIIIIGAVDNIKARRYIHDAFINKDIDTVYYIDTGNGDKDQSGQTVLGYKKNYQIQIPPVAFQFPQILQEEKKPKTESTYHCSSGIQEHPQNLATNILSATVTFEMLNNIISKNDTKSKFVKFNADNVSVGIESSEKIFVVELIKITTNFEIDNKIKLLSYQDAEKEYSRLLNEVTKNKEFLTTDSVNGKETKVADKQGNRYKISMFEVNLG